MITRRLVAAALMLGVAGCKPRPTKSGLECYPADVRPWITPSPILNQVQAVQVSIYIDGSGSMAGYVHGGNDEERPYQELLRILPTLTDAKAESVRWFKFNTTSTLVKPEDNADFETAAAYSGYDSGQSRIDIALSGIASEELNSLSFLITDFWMVNNDREVNDAVALGEPVDRIFASGRSIAVYGIDSPFKGLIGDLPDGRRPVAAARHYVYMVAVGTAERLAALHSQLQTSVSRGLRDGLTNGKINYGLFSLTPASGLSAGTVTLNQPHALRQDRFLTPVDGANVPQFTLRAQDIGSGEDEALRWQGIVSADPGLVWKGEAESNVTYRKVYGDICGPAAWDEVVSPVPLGRSEDPIKQIIFSASDLAAQLPGIRACWMGQDCVKG